MDFIFFKDLWESLKQSEDLSAWLKKINME